MTDAPSAGTLERRLFEVLGGWVPSTAEPEAKLLFRVHSFHHARHAELWESVGGDVPEAERLAETVEDMASVQGTVDRLAAAYRRVLPAVVAVYAAARVDAEAAARGPLVRALGVMLDDDEAAIREGERVLMMVAGEQAVANSP